MNRSFLEEAKAGLESTIDLRRRIHRYPELGNHLPRTKAAVLDAIANLDLDVHESKTTSGVVASLKGTQSGRVIVLRGDMDALPMPEDTGLPFSSELENRMHACGHDSHTAMLAGAARVLSAHRDELAGEVRFMFQPGEEGPGGAGPMINEGLLDTGGSPDAAFALHILPDLASGHISCRPGPVLASSETVRVKIIGRGGHGSMPYDANDPVPVICELVHAFQTFISRRIHTFDPVVLTVGEIHAGTLNTIIPEFAELSATLRSFSEKARALAHEGIRRLSSHIAQAHEMHAEVCIGEKYPATLNDPDFVEFIRKTTEMHLGAGKYVDMPQPLMAAEDFSLVLQRIPGAMAFLGVLPEGVDPVRAAACHSSRMVLDESAMASGVAMHAALAHDFLTQTS